MEKNDLRILLSIEDRVIAADIQNVLEAYGIYTLLVSDNPALSVLSTYIGSNPIESIDIQLNKEDYERAVDILNNSSYKDLIDNV